MNKKEEEANLLLKMFVCHFVKTFCRKGFAGNEK